MSTCLSAMSISSVVKGHFMQADVVRLFDCHVVWAAAMLQGNSSASGADHACWAGRPARTGV